MGANSDTKSKENVPEPTTVIKNPDGSVDKYYDDKTVTLDAAHYFKDVQLITVKLKGGEEKTVTPGNVNTYMVAQYQEVPDGTKGYDAGTISEGGHFPYAYTYEPISQSAVIAYCALALTVGLVAGYLAKARTT